MPAVPPVAAGFSPLDDELGLLPGSLTPPLQAHLSRLGTRLSFAEAASERWHLKGVHVSAATARRRTEADGAILAAQEAATAAQVLAMAPPPPSGPAVQQVRVDGAMAPLVDGSWREVRTMAIGTVLPGRDPGSVRCAERSYFSRLADAATFTTLAAGEVHRRGVETAGVVVGVVDGAAWCQTFLDTHCPDAVRMLDFAHAAQRLSIVSEAVWGVGDPATTWAATQRAVLREGDPEHMLAAIRAVPLPVGPLATLAASVQAEVLGDLTPRVEQMRYAAFRARGLPIGSGVVESANKLVVEARLKGAGRRWAERHVTPMVALRGALCSERWEEAWTQIAQERRTPHPAPVAVAPHPAPSAASVVIPNRRAVHPAIPDLPPQGPQRVVNGRPTAAHPWKRFRAVPPTSTKL